VVELDWWQSARRGRWTITCLPSQHGSRRIGQAANESLWCAWLLDSGDARYFFAGDTGYSKDFADIGARFGGFDLAAIPIGAYEPRWFMRSAHMNPAEALAAGRALGARRLIPMHWGSFDLSDEAIDEPPRALARALDLPENRGLRARVRLPAIGETVRLDD